MKWSRIFAAGALLVSTLFSIPVLPAGAVSTAPAPIQLTMLQDFSAYSTGQELNAPGNIPVSPPSAAAGARAGDTLGAPGAARAVSLYAQNVGGYATATDLFYEVFYPQNTSLQSLEGVMAYIRLPKGKPGDRYSLFHFNLYTIKNNTPAWTNAGNAPVQYLGVRDTAWHTVTAFDGHIKLPYGFEGYVKLRFADLPAGTQAALSGAQAVSSTFRFREIGGARGSAVVNALYGITADSAAVTARLGGTGRDVYLATGRPDDGFNILPLANAGVAGARQDFSGFDPGDDVKASGLFTSTKSDVTALAVPDISGLDDGPALEIQSPTLSGFRDTDPQYEVFFSQDTRMDGTQGLLLYIKCGGPHPQDATSKVFFSLYSTRENEANFTNLGSGTAQVLPKGGDAWSEVTASEGILTLPAGFEGYILAPLTEMRQDSVAGRTDNRYAISVSFRFLALGGAAGSTTLDGLYLLSGMGNDPRLLTLNGCDVQDLSTGGRISDPLKLTMLQDFSSYEEGDNLRGADKVVISPESAASATATGARGLTAPGSEGAVVLNSTELGGFATANNLIYEVFSPPDTQMNGLEGVMLYIRLPKGRPGDRYSLFHFTLFSYKNETPAWTNAGNAPVQILARRSDRWQTVTASDGNIRLPYGFEGYVKLRFVDLPADKRAALSGARLISTSLQFREIGGDRGPAVLHAIYGVQRDGNAAVASLPGSGNLYLNGGASVSGASAGAADAIQAEPLLHFDGFASGDDVLASGMAAFTKSDVSAAAVPGISGQDNGPALSIQSSTLSGFRDTDPHYEVFYRDNARLDGMTALLLYVRCPQPYPGEAVSRMKFNLYSTRGSQANFTHLGDGTARILPKGGTNWTDSVASEGILSLPAGFEGYILAPFAEMRQDSIAGQTAGRVAVSTTFQFSALGGEAGGFLVDSICGVRAFGSGGTQLTLGGARTLDMTSGIPYDPVSGTVQREFAPFCGEEDALLLKNPQRGFRMETFVNVANLAQDYQVLQPDPTIRLKDCIAQYVPESPQLAQVYFYLTGYKNTPVIPDYGIQRIQAYFDYARQVHVQLLVRFAYQADMNGVGEAPQSVMLSHMRQLRTLLEANRDIIHVVQAGFLGAWGEWHSYKQPHDQVELLRGLEAMTPAGLAIQVRIPDYKNLIPKTDPLYSRLSFHNDSVFGEAAGGTGGVDPGTAQWQQFTRESPYQPVDGELFWGSWSLDPNEGGYLIDGYKVLKELSEHHFTSLSLHHNYREDGPSKRYSMQIWKENPVTESWLRANGILYAPGWFRNDGGQTAQRQVFDFVRDYLGYKLEASSLTVTGGRNPGGTMQVGLQLANYGFSVPFNMESGFAILDEENRVVSTVSAGTPSGWHSRNPADYTDAARLTHTISGRVSLPNEHGRYRLAFYLKDTAGNPARLGSRMPFAGGYHILEELSI